MDMLLGIKSWMYCGLAIKSTSDITIYLNA